MTSWPGGATRSTGGERSGARRAGAARDRASLSRGLHGYAGARVARWIEGKLRLPARLGQTPSNLSGGRAAHASRALRRPPLPGEPWCRASGLAQLVPSGPETLQESAVMGTFAWSFVNSWATSSPTMSDRRLSIWPNFTHVVPSSTSAPRNLSPSLNPARAGSALRVSRPVRALGPSGLFALLTQAASPNRARTSPTSRRRSRWRTRAIVRSSMIVARELRRRDRGRSSTLRRAVRSVGGTGRYVCIEGVHRTPRSSRKPTLNCGNELWSSADIRRCLRASLELGRRWAHPSSFIDRRRHAVVRRAARRAAAGSRQ
jgi:hypothetical protein